MEKHQELEWAEAQRIVIISEDLVAAAKQQLKFLAAVDRNTDLYGGPALDRAIYRYKNLWLPLLAKHNSQLPEGLLVVPLDCEWIWHCHRLSPVRYKMDCLELYGKILDSKNVLSSVCGASKERTEELWNKMYPNEPYELNLCGYEKNVAFENIVEASKSTSYDLVSAVKRQSPFYYQVSRPTMNNDLFLEVAVARYKGFLHLIKRNEENNIGSFCVPTYDIDLIWHSHQLHPISYSKDLGAILGEVLDHDDMDSDRSKGQKLDLGFRGTTKQWEDLFGLRYWRAGSMYRGTPPSALTMDLHQLKSTFSKKAVLGVENEEIITLPKRQLVEVMLEIVEARNLPSEHADTFFVSLTKKQTDPFFKTTRNLPISPNPKEKQFTSFQCEPTGEFLFQLKSSSLFKTMGTTLISLDELFNPLSKLVVDKWLELVPTTEFGKSKPVSLRIAISFTSPVQAPYVMEMVMKDLSPRSPLFSLSEKGYNRKSWTHVVDGFGNELISIQMRIPEKSQGGNNGISKKEVIGMTESGETCVILAEFNGQEWSIMSSQCSFQLHKKASEKGDLIGMLTGSQKVAIFQGRKLGYETKNSEMKKTEQDFISIVEFSAESPYGKAVALLNLKSGFLRIEEECFVLPGIALAFILSEIPQKGGYGGIFNTKGVKEIDGGDEGVAASNGFSGCNYGGTGACGSSLAESCDFSSYDAAGSCGSSLVESSDFSGYDGAGACSGSGGCGGACGGGCGGGARCGGARCGGGSCRSK